MSATGRWCGGGDALTRVPWRSVRSVVALVYVSWALASHAELCAFPMNRLLPLTLTLLASAVCLFAHRLLFLGGVIALDQVCSVEGYTYLISTLASAGMVVAVAVQLLVVRVLSPMDAAEGCADFHLRTASVLLTTAVGVLPAVGMALIISVANDSDFWPSPFRTMPHSFEWQRKLFDYPLGGMLLWTAFLMFALHMGVIFRCCRGDPNENTFRRGERGLEGGLRRPRDRLWTVDRVACVLTVYLVTWVPGAALAAATMLDLPAAYMELMVATEGMDAARGIVVAVAVCVLLQVPEFVRWSRNSVYSPVRRHAAAAGGGPLSTLANAMLALRARHMPAVVAQGEAAGGSGGGGGGSGSDEHVEEGGRDGPDAGSEAEDLPPVSSASAPRPAWTMETIESGNHGGDVAGAAQSDEEDGRARPSVQPEDEPENEHRGDTSRQATSNVDDEEEQRVPLLPERVAWVGGGGDGGGREGGRGWRAPFVYTFYESWAYSASLYLRFPPPDS